MLSVPSPAAPSSVQSPSGIHPCCHLPAPRDGTESQPPPDSSRKHAPPHAPRSAAQSPSPLRCRISFRHTESIADTSTPAAETPSPEYPVATTNPVPCHPSGAATSPPTPEARPDPASAWQTETPAAGPQSTHCPFAQTGSHKPRDPSPQLTSGLKENPIPYIESPPQSPRDDTYPESCP